MAVLTIQGFSGIAPLFEPRQLPPNLATTATDCRFQGGDLRSLRTNIPVRSWTYQVGMLFHYRGDWLAWPKQPYGEVSVVASPIPQDSLQRVYWTRWDGTENGNNFPQAASQPVSADIAQQNAFAIRRLGVPAPTTEPKVNEVAALATAAAITMSQTSPVTVSAPNHPFKEGQRVVVRFTAAAPSEESEGVTGMRELSGREFIVASVTASTFALRDSDGSNYSAYDRAKDPATIERVYGETDLITRSYCYTFVSNWGEEGPPSPPSKPFDIRFDSNVALEITGAVANSYGGINRVRIYRSAASGTQAGFFFLAEVGIAPTPSYVANYQDVTTEDAMFATLGTKPDSVETQAAVRVLGEQLPSIEWTPPINGLRGLTLMPNGYLVAFKGNTLYMSEPYMPHAWPDRYRRTVPSDIQGIATAGQSLVIATKGKPQIGFGADPSSFSLQELDADAPCIVPGSVCSVGFGVAYASHDGLFLITAGAAPRNISEHYFTKEQWASAISSTMRAIFHDRRYLLLSDSPSTLSIMVEIDGDKVHFSKTTDVGRAPAVNADDDSLHFMASGWLDQVQFDGDGGARAAMWVSKMFTMPKPVNFACAQVFAASYPLTLRVASSAQTAAVPIGPAGFTGQTSGTMFPRAQLTVYGPDPFRLPDGFLAREWQVDLRSFSYVHQVVLAESMEELARL